MNPLAFLTILFGTAAIILAYALLAARDEAAGWRIHAHIQYRLQTASDDLLRHCEDLEAHNDWLESQRDHCKDVVAMSIAQSRLPRREKAKMVVVEMQEAP